MTLNIEKLTVEAFWQQYEGQDVELIEGEVRKVSPAGFEASDIANLISTYLTIFVIRQQLGRVTGADGGYRLAVDTVLAPDAAYISYDRIPKDADRTKYLPAVPNLVAEVISPSDRAQAVREKLNIYMDADVELVWLVYPGLREVVVHAPGREETRLGDTDTLDGEAVLAGFQLPIADIFPPSVAELLEDEDPTD